MDLKKEIKTKREHLSDSSIVTYASILRNLHKKIFGDEEMTLSNFNKSKKILKFMDDYESKKRKTILSALYILTENEKYKNKMKEDITVYQNDINKQEKTEKQKNNWITSAEIENKLNELKDNANIIYKSGKNSMIYMQDIQNYIILCLLSGYYIPPRRSKDYCDFRIDLTDEDDDNNEYNHFNKDMTKMIFQNYKTAKTYGKQVIQIPAKLKKILIKWKSINPTQYLLFDNNCNKMTNVKLTQRLNRIFDNKKISINNFRHTYLTEKYNNTVELDKDLSQMGTSRNMLTNYVKK